MSINFKPQISITSSSEREVAGLGDSADANVADGTFGGLLIIADEMSAFAALCKGLASAIRAEIEVFVGDNLASHAPLVGALTDGLVLGQLERPHKFELVLTHRVDGYAK